MIGFNVVEASPKNQTRIYEHCCFTSQPHELTVVFIPCSTPSVYTRENALKSASEMNMKSVVKYRFEAIDASNDAERELEASLQRIQQRCQ